MMQACFNSCGPAAPLPMPWPPPAAGGSGVLRQYSGIVLADGTVSAGHTDMTVTKLGTGQYRVNHGAGVLPATYVAMLTPSSVGGSPTYAVLGEQTGTSFTVFTFRENGQPQDAAFEFMVSSTG